MTALDDVAGFHSEMMNRTVRTRGVDLTLFVLNLKTTPWVRPYPKRVVTILARGQRKKQTETEMVRMHARSTAYVIKAPAIAKSMLKSASKRVGDEAERIQEIALSSTIWSHKKRERPELNVARGDALVVLEDDPC